MAVTYKIAKALNGGLWKWTDGEEKVFTILGPIRAGRVVDNPRNGIAKAPDILSVRDAADGNEKEVLVGQVLKSSLVENYPDDAYVGKSFACTQSLRQHIIMLHNGGQRVNCLLCHQSFARIDHLKRHVRAYHWEKTYDCSLCAKKFARPSALQMHERVHRARGENPFSCPVCSTSFSESTDLDHHLKVHF